MTTPAPTQAAARERAARTFFTGLGLDVAIAVATALAAWLPGAVITDKTAWVLLGTVLVKTILQAVVAYVLRLKLQPATEVDGAFVITDADGRRPA